MRLPSKSDSGSRGFGLIELMIAVALGLLILVAISQLFIGSRLTYNTADALARVQENGRFALEILKPELRDLGGEGFCAGRGNVTNHLDLDCDPDMEDVFNQDTPVTGWEYANTGIGDSLTLPDNLDPGDTNVNDWSSRRNGTTRPLPSALDGLVVPGSDVLVVQRVELIAEVQVNGVQSSNRIRLDGGGNLIPPRGIVMVMNCAEGGDIFQGGPGQGNDPDLFKPSQNCSDGQPGNNPPGGSPWNHQHDETSSVFSESRVAYFVGYNAARDEPGLYRADMSAGLDPDDIVVEELVQGIENMQVLYGFSRPAPQGDGQFVDFWLTADQVTDWGLVMAVRLSVLARSQAAADVQREQFTFDLSRTQVTHPEDRLLRQPFSTTVALRNRMITQ